MSNADYVQQVLPGYEKLVLVKPSFLDLDEMLVYLNDIGKEGIGRNTIVARLSFAFGIDEISEAEQVVTYWEATQKEAKS